MNSIWSIINFPNLDTFSRNHNSVDMLMKKLVNFAEYFPIIKMDLKVINRLWLVYWVIIVTFFIWNFLRFMEHLLKLGNCNYKFLFCCMYLLHRLFRREGGLPVMHGLWHPCSRYQPSMNDFSYHLVSLELYNWESHT